MTPIDAERALELSNRVSSTVQHTHDIDSAVLDDYGTG
jgi:hypothetical protein